MQAGQGKRIDTDMSVRPYVIIGDVSFNAEMRRISSVYCVFCF